MTHVPTRKAECHVCGKLCRSWGGLHKHLSATHKMQAVDYYGKNLDQLQLRLLEFVEREYPEVEGCWEWNGNRDPERQYGRVRVAGVKTCAAHRISYWAFKGVLPSDDMAVCHSCDNPPCVNPKHLSLGSILENNQNRAAKGYTDNGRGRGLLADETVLAIKERLGWGWTLSRIYRETGVSIGSIAQIRDGRAYAYVEFNPNDIPF